MESTAGAHTARSFGANAPFPSEIYGVVESAIVTFIDDKPVKEPIASCNLPLTPSPFRKRHKRFNVSLSMFDSSLNAV